jgi:N-carbamoyl-L-amino-acid hydrolase
MAVGQHVNRERLRSDIETNAEFGKMQTDEGRGRTALPGTTANRECREFLVSSLNECGFEVRIDAVGNISGQWTPPGSSRNTSPVVTGSHLDSVPEGGIFDGPLGIYAGLEAVRALQAADRELHRPIRVVSFSEEEGYRFSDGVLGSSVASGDIDVEEALASEDRDGVSLREVLSDIGFKGEGRIRADQWDSWIELHVEQGDYLEVAEITAGVVTSIVGTIRCHVVLTGEPNHAGTTSMSRRNDPIPAASEIILAVEDIVENKLAIGHKTAVGTVGEVRVEPNVINIVPEHVELGIDIRDVDYTVMKSIMDHVEARLKDVSDERDIGVNFSRPYDIRPVQMSTRCQSAIHRAAKEASVSVMDLHSGAGHDTMQIARVTDGGMIFAPSRRGLSHSTQEWTDWSDCAECTRVLAGSLACLASK